MNANTKIVPTLKEVASFLNGSAALDGVWFGEPHPNCAGMYWWRSILLKAIECANAAPEQAEGEAVYLVERDAETWCEISLHDYNVYKNNGDNGVRIFYTAAPSVAIDEAMVLRACNAFDNAIDAEVGCEYPVMYAALKAALEHTQ